MSKVTDRIHERLVEQRKQTYFQMLSKAYFENRDTILKETAEEIVLPIIARYAQQEIVDKPWKVEGESKFRRYAVIKGKGKNKRIIAVKTLGDQRLEKKKLTGFADGFKIEMKDGGYIVHSYELPPNSSIYPPSPEKNNQPWDPDKFEEYLLEGNIFAPPDFNPFGRYQFLSEEEYEEYKKAPADENRYPARDFYEMAFKEIHSDEVQERLAKKFIEKVISHIKPI